MCLKFRDPSEDNVIYTNNLLANCSKLRHVDIVHDDEATAIEELDSSTSAQWFAQWSCPNILSLQLEEFSNTSYGDYSSEEDDFEYGSDVHDSDENSDHGTTASSDSAPQMKHMVQLPRFHFPVDREFLNNVSSQGWTFQGHDERY